MSSCDNQKCLPDTAKCPLENKLIPVEKHCPKIAKMFSSPSSSAASSLSCFLPHLLCSASPLYKSICLASLLFSECTGHLSSAPALSSACNILPPGICMAHMVSRKDLPKGHLLSEAFLGFLIENFNPPYFLSLLHIIFQRMLYPLT